MADETVDVLIIGAGASGAAIAWSLAETRMRVVCFEQGDWMNPLDYPSTRTSWELERFGKKFEIGLVSNIDDKLLGQTRRHFKSDFDLVVTAQQVRSYKPDPAHFTEAERRMGTKKGWVHVGASYYHDVEPALKKKIPVVWVNRHKQALEPSQKKPTAEVHNLREAAKLLGAA